MTAILRAVAVIALAFSRAGRQAAIEGTQCGIGPPNRHGGKP
jgi:hypothetical protein